MSVFIHSSVAEMKEQIGVCSRSVFGVEPCQMSFLFFLMYAAAAGGLLALLESTPGCAQEFKIKGGTQQLSECLAQRVGWKNVRLGSAVMAIWQVEYSNISLGGLMRSDTEITAPSLGKQPVSSEGSLSSA
ncbi:hypothetical protein XENOCAPTIV_016695 [Xenoophorus captivus]|uniref:Uncharacterized protein n=1 Tax=Xenoophorus captivus TaxID=1517983 RepID=A0ABV0SHR8_9TELE